VKILTLDVKRYMVYIFSVIRSFKDKEAERIFNREPSGRLPAAIHRVVLRKLRMLNSAVTLGDLKSPPANRLEKLKADRAGLYSIRINDQWRICFEWQNGDAFHVEIVDYH
jgi:toxin HigB-1